MRSLKLLAMVSKQHTLFYGSSYDRGLDILLYVWPDIKATYPDAELHICYGWELFDMVATGNPERKQWRKTVTGLMNQDGVIHHGRLGQDELKKVRQMCGIWIYPTYFQEINCITALESQADGLVPVVMDLGALSETAKEGIIVKGDIQEFKVQQEFTKHVISLMGDKERWKKLSNKCKKFTNTYHWPTIASKWTEYFDEPLVNPTVSIVTLTIREGFWNIMAQNIASQTYKPLEWIIVDDYPEDRSKIAKKYADKYNLTIRYLRGSKHGTSPPYPRRCGLVRANNIGWKNAKGELLVWLQDFILIPENGIEQLVDVYRHNPDALIAPTDIRYNSIKPSQDNKDDWWNGETNVLTKEDWRNIRNKKEGMRESDNAFDFEMNYGATPRKILEDLNGFWEFFDDGLGYDNTEVAYRALKMGYRIIIDDTNVAKCINLWPYIGGKEQNISGRERILNTPRWQWFLQANLPLKRDQKLDSSIKLPFEVPKELKDEECANWINEHATEIVKTWIK
jgi:glycosyltransferase involved in cell wall biosynthesis